MNRLANDYRPNNDVPLTNDERQRQNRPANLDVLRRIGAWRAQQAPQQGKSRKSKRPLTEYNKFVKKILGQLSSSMPQKEKFREAAHMWKLQNKRTSKGSTSSRTSSRRPLRTVYGSSSSRSRKSSRRPLRTSKGSTSSRTSSRRPRVSDDKII